MPTQSLPAIDKLGMSDPAPKEIADLPDELLTSVLSMVPPEHRIGIRRVPQKWNGIISDIGYHLEPLFVNGRDGKPWYPARVPIQVHPILDSRRVAIKMYKGACPNYLFDSDELSNANARRRRLDYLTSPPISVVMLQSYQNSHDGSFIEDIHVILRTASSVSKRPEGIRVGDFLDALDKLHESGKDIGKVTEDAMAFSICFDEKQWEIAEQAVGSSGIEVRTQVYVPTKVPLEQMAKYKYWA
jgi:hypothetical protein